MASPNGQPASAPSQTPRQKRKYPHEHTPSPRRPNDDSPSRQLMLELSLQTVEQRRKFYEKLDREALEREQHHLRALDIAAAEHDRVRRNAQLAQELLQLEIERRRQQEENEQMKAIDQEKQQLVDREIAAQRRAFEESRRLAEKEKAAAEAKAAAEQAERNRREQQARDEEEAANKATAAAAAAAAAAATAPPQVSVAAPPSDKPPDKQPTTSALSPSFQLDRTPAKPPQLAPSQGSSAREAEHTRFLQLHKSLKTMRANIISQSKANAALKSRIGDMRRAIRKSVGQLTADPETRKAPLRNIRTTLNEALTNHPQPAIDATPYIVSQPLPQTGPPPQIPALLLYLLNIFAKSVVSQFTSESGADPKTADPIGIVAISIFAHKDYKLGGETSLIDLLLAKFHLVCPVLFGISGSETTEAGRRRLGWHIDPDTGKWVTDQRHTERMTGLGAGFAALALRNFQNSTSVNPYPPSHFWRAIAGILNTPSDAITQTHCTVLRAMIENHAPRFIAFYGAAAVAVLRLAVVEFPRRAPKTTASNVLATLAATFRRDLHLTL